MKKILLYPGAFNPPHYGHVAILEIALRNSLFDEVWIVPSGKHDDKVIPTTYDNRRKLGGLFVDYLNSKINVPVKLITAELDDAGGKFTHEILKEIKSQDGVDVTQLIGLDGFLNLFPKLTNEKEKFIIVRRTGYEMPSDVVFGDNITFLSEGTNDSISSTQIRGMIQNHNKDFTKFLPENIAEYIEDNNLYL